MISCSARNKFKRMGATEPAVDIFQIGYSEIGIIS